MKRVTERADLAGKQVPEYISGCRQFEGEDLSKLLIPFLHIVLNQITGLLFEFCVSQWLIYALIVILAQQSNG